MNFDFDAMRSVYKSQLKKQSNALILRAAPEHAQRNAALGVLDDDEAQAVRNAIVALRDAYRAKLDEIDAIIADAEKTDREKYRDLRSIDLRIS